MENKLTEAIYSNRKEVEDIIKSTLDWNIATTYFDSLFKSMANPNDPLWSKEMIEELHSVYFKARAEDKECKNITERTVNAMLKSKANATKKIFLQIANTCRIFHASHKVNFEEQELPSDFDEIAMKSSKKKGFFTYKEEMPSLYQKTSLTFDYWIPKILDWTQEIRGKKIRTWQGEDILQHESCTDFMRIALMFLSDPGNHLPIAKWDIRESLLTKCFNEEFIWIKKSTKHEDISTNSKLLKKHLNNVAIETGLNIPTEAWNRILNLKSIKIILK